MKPVQTKYVKRFMWTCFVLFATIVLCETGAPAEIKEVSAKGSHIKSELETEEYAANKALRKAESNAVHKAGIYLGSIRVVQGRILTENKVQAIAAGLIAIKEINEEWDGSRVTVTITAAVDTSKIEKDLDFLDSTGIFTSWVKTRQEKQKLEKRHEELLKELASANDPQKKQAVKRNIDNTSMKLKAMDQFQHAYKHQLAGRLEEAVTAYSRTIEIKPDHAESYNNRGVAKQQLERNEEALKDYDAAIRIKPGYAEAHFNRGFTNWKLNPNLTEVILKDFDAGISCNPEQGRYYYARGVVYQKMGEFDRALQDFNKAIDLMPKFPPAYYCRGGSYYEKRDYDNAIIDWDAVIKLDPGHRNAYYYRGMAYREKGDRVRGLEDLKKSCQLGHQEACKRANRLSGN